MSKYASLWKLAAKAWRAHAEATESALAEEASTNVDRLRTIETAQAVKREAWLKERDELQAESALRREALERVQWDRDGHCPVCDVRFAEGCTNTPGKHRPDCQIVHALNGERK